MNSSGLSYCFPTDLVLISHFLSTISPPPLFTSPSSTLILVFGLSALFVPSLAFSFKVKAVVLFLFDILILKFCLCGLICLRNFAREPHLENCSVSNCFFDLVKISPFLCSTTASFESVSFPINQENKDSKSTGKVSACSYQVCYKYTV